MGDQVKQIAWTLARVFIGSLIGFILANGVGVLDMGPTQWRAAVGAAISACLVAIFNYLNPGDDRYGMGYEPPQS